MAPGDYGNKAVPTYIAAEAETTPLPKITVPEAPPPPNSGRALGDLPMRVVYRVIAGAVAVVVVGTVATVVLLNRDDAAPRAQAADIPVGVQPTAMPTTGESPGESTGLTSGPTSGPTAEALAATAGPDGATPSPESSQSSSAASDSPSGARSAMDAALSDPRVPTLTTSTRKLRALPGRTTTTRGLVKDQRSGVAFPRFAKVWKAARGNPFASRQMLPAAKGSQFRGMLVSCPVPIPVQESLRDTAFLAARWTLNHQPSGATITWSASQPLKVSKRDGWLLGYRVNYTIKGKKRTSSAALALLDVPGRKPGLVFISIPDSQEKYWKDIYKVMSSLHVLPQENED
ncbi:hypothetical protein ACFHYQ_00050 [Sphaerimonospora cavernae]|uniref:Uncharacterized protein n=1 Tax=Sphaerimonospora cavernae TaxID=1740611 RepID=A0ABV6U0Q3_9ACTN